MIFVTGATGTVGSQLSHIFAKQGVPFRAGIHRRSLDTQNIETCFIDYNRPDTLQHALDGIKKLFFALPLLFDQQSMIAAVQAMVDAALKAGVEHIVKLSAYGASDEGYPHARWHRQVEKNIEASGIAWTFLRPNAFMQTLLDDWAESILNEGVFYDAVDGASYAPIDARDIARVAAHTLTQRGYEGRVYELTGPESMSWEAAAGILSRVLNRTIHYIRIGEEDLRHKLLEEGLSEEMANAWVEVHRYTKKFPSAITTSVLDITGSKPSSFEEFCRDHAHILRG